MDVAIALPSTSTGKRGWAKAGLRCRCGCSNLAAAECQELFIQMSYHPSQHQIHIYIYICHLLILLSLPTKIRYPLHIQVLFDPFVHNQRWSEVLFILLRDRPSSNWLLAHPAVVPLSREGWGLDSGFAKLGPWDCWDTEALKTNWRHLGCFYWAFKSTIMMNHSYVMLTANGW